jgi:AraC-like DNA-binding protein
MFVRSYSQRQIERLATPLGQAVPARLEQTLEFQFRDSYTVIFDGGEKTVAPSAVVIGLNTKRANMVLSAAIESFAIFFQPSGFSRVIATPVREISERHFEAAEILGRSAVELAEKLADKTFEERVRIAEEFLLPLALRAPAMDSVARAAQHAFVERGRTQVSELARHCGLSVRQFQRKFKAGFGIGPKVFARVARFQSALDAKIARPTLSWLEIAHDLGYHDQMHLIRDFKGLGGGAPGVLLQQIADGRPPALTTDTVRELIL